MNINPSKLSVWDQPEAFLVPTADSNCDVRDDKMVQNPHLRTHSPKWRANRDIISTSRWTSRADLDPDISPAVALLSHLSYRLLQLGRTWPTLQGGWFGFAPFDKFAGRDVRC